MSDEITASEVYRHLLRQSEQLNRIESMVIPRAEFEAYKTEIDRRLSINDESAEREHGSLHARVDSVLNSQHETQREQLRQSKEFNAKMWVAVLGAGVSVIGSVFLGIIG